MGALVADGGEGQQHPHLVDDVGMAPADARVDHRDDRAAAGDAEIVPDLGRAHLRHAALDLVDLRHRAERALGEAVPLEAQMEKVAKFAFGKGACSLIEMAAAPVRSAVALFPDEFGVSR